MKTGDYRPKNGGDLLRWTAHCAFGTIHRFHGSDHRPWTYDNHTEDVIRCVQNQTQQTRASVAGERLLERLLEQAGLTTPMPLPCAGPALQVVPHHPLQDGALAHRWRPPRCCHGLPVRDARRPFLARARGRWRRVQHAVHFPERHAGRADLRQFNQRVYTQRVDSTRRLGAGVGRQLRHRCVRNQNQLARACRE